MIVEQCHVTIDCFDVATHLMGLPVRIVDPTFKLERSLSETGPFSILIVRLDGFSTYPTPRQPTAPRCCWTQASCRGRSLLPLKAARRARKWGPCCRRRRHTTGDAHISRKPPRYCQRGARSDARLGLRSREAGSGQTDLHSLARAPAAVRS